jgi:hypothetical protein
MLFADIYAAESTYRIYIPNHHSGVFRSGSKFSAIRREATEPNFITVIVENLPCLQWKLIPEMNQ